MIGDIMSEELTEEEKLKKKLEEQKEKNRIIERKLNTTTNIFYIGNKPFPFKGQNYSFGESIEVNLIEYENLLNDRHFRDPKSFHERYGENKLVVERSDVKEVVEEPKTAKKSKKGVK